ncbi:MAG: TRAP transporter large permease subunit [Comamonadaceae bacterium]|nr:TRAP transporter large permease subunit [Comamonadaceae bacterium]
MAVIPTAAVLPGAVPDGRDRRAQVRHAARSTFDKVDTAWNLTRRYGFHFLSLVVDRRLHDDGLLAGAVGVLGDGRRVRHQLPAPRHARCCPMTCSAARPSARPVRLAAGQGARRRLDRRAQRRRHLRRRRHHRRRGDAHRARPEVQRASSSTTPAARLLLTAVFTALVVWIVGLAVPVTASYIICAVIAAPALIKLGVPDFAAHMFIFYYAVLSEVSPPTALSPFAAAAITGGDPYKTTLQCWKYTLPAFLRAVHVRARPDRAGPAADGLDQGPGRRQLVVDRRGHASPRRSASPRSPPASRAGPRKTTSVAERVMLHRRRLRAGATRASRPTSIGFGCAATRRGAAGAQARTAGLGSRRRPEGSSAQLITPICQGTNSWSPQAQHLALRALRRRRCAASARRCCRPICVDRRRTVEHLAAVDVHVFFHAGGTSACWWRA